jgi:tetratricopeptide (TPR) repeat protein
MSEPSKAVFLSYASEDVEAAKKICDALRAAGVEVWFDQSELRGGDQWDAKIRRQIKDCALFMPVISANTNARAEGYFRLEWKLAVDRSHLMADDAHFLFPIVIDDTPDTAARVPDKFREVQWTRLNVKDTPTILAERVARLLTGSHGGSDRVGETAESRERGVRRHRPAWLRYAWSVVGIVIALGYGLRPLWQSDRDGEAKTPSPPATTPAAPASALSEARQLAAKAKAFYEKVGFTRDDLAVGEDLTRRATELEPDSAVAWGVRAGVHSSYIFRNWDVSEKRRQDTQAFANRALALNPDETEALLALSRVLSRQGANDQAEALLRRTLTLTPDDNRVRRALGIVIELQSPERLLEGRAVLEEAVRRHPRDVLARYDLAQSYSTNWGPGNDPSASFEAMIEQLDAALAVQPWGGALLLKAQMVMAERGDLVAMRATLDQLPPADRTEDRAVFVAMWCGLLERKPERVLTAAGLTARNYFEDLTIAGPKAWPMALAHRIAGQENLARLDWEAAEAVMRSRVRDQPGNLAETARLAITLAWLGRNDEAASLMAPIESTLREQPSWRVARLVALYYAGLGDAARAAPYLRAALYQSMFVTPATLPLDPWWDKLRGQPEFEALLSGPVAVVASAASSTPHPAAPAGPTDPQLKRAAQLIDSFDSITADIGLAEDMVKAVLTARPTDVEATILMGRIQGYVLLRGFDRSEERFALARQYSERALALAPDDPEALSDMATYLYARRIELPRAARLFRQAVALRPTEARYYRMLDNVLSVTEGVPDADVLASSRRTAELFPQDALAQYEAARHYRDAGLLEPAEHYFDLAIKLGPVANALLAKAQLALSVRGDLAGLKALPEQLPERYRGTDRAVFAQFVYALASGRYAVGLEALRSLPEPWMIDFDFTGPTSLLAGELLFLEGKPELARLKFEDAQAEMSRHMATQTRNFSTLWLDAWILMRLGRVDEARARNAVIFPELQRPFRIYLGTNWWFSPIPGNLLLGERGQAVALIREAVTFQYGRAVIRQALRSDPRMAPWRDDKEIAALLAEPEAKK